MRTSRPRTPSSMSGSRCPDARSQISRRSMYRPLGRARRQRQPRTFRADRERAQGDAERRRDRPAPLELAEDPAGRDVRLGQPHRPIRVARLLQDDELATAVGEPRPAGMLRGLCRSRARPAGRRRRATRGRCHRRRASARRPSDGPDRDLAPTARAEAGRAQEAAGGQLAHLAVGGVPRREDQETAIRAEGRRAARAMRARQAHPSRRPGRPQDRTGPGPRRDPASWSSSPGAGRPGRSDLHTRCSPGPQGRPGPAPLDLEDPEACGRDHARRLAPRAFRGSHEAAVGAELGRGVILVGRDQVDPLAAVGHVEHPQVAAVRGRCPGPTGRRSSSPGRCASRSRSRATSG